MRACAKVRIERWTLTDQVVKVDCVHAKALKRCVARGPDRRPELLFRLHRAGRVLCRNNKFITTDRLHSFAQHCFVEQHAIVGLRRVAFGRVKHIDTMVDALLDDSDTLGVRKWLAV